MPDLKSDEIEKLKLIEVQGRIVERDALNIAEKISIYDPNLYVQVLDGPAVDLQTPPFRVMEICKDGVHRVAMTAWTLDGQLFDRIVAADTSHYDILGKMDKNNDKARNEDRRRYQEKMDQLHELSFDVLRSPKDTYTAKHPETGEKLTFKA